MQSKAKRTVLLTNLFLCSRTGSELHTLEMAQEFRRRGYEVDCFAFIHAYPLASEFQRSAIRVITPETIDGLRDHYDVFFAQHRDVSEYIWNETKIQFSKIVVSILGLPNVTKHERLPYFADRANLILFVSEEAKESCPAIPQSVETLIFPNYATEQFFIDKKERHAQTPNRIAVISNHIADELRNLGEIASAKGITVDFFGYEAKSVEITPKLLSEYDLVISIGRTAQCCFASYTPFYCYDHFGGPGYIEPGQIREHADYNFSGRSNPVKRTGTQLFFDIMENYESQLHNLSKLRSFADTNSNFHSHFNQFEAMLYSSAKNTGNQSCRLVEERDRENSENSYEVIKLSEEKHFGVAQIFYASNKELAPIATEDCSLKIRYRYNSLIKVDTKKFLDEDQVVIRFDPDEAPCACILKTQGTPLNGLTKDNNGKDIFLTSDPSYVDTNPESVVFLASHLASSDLCFYANEAIESLQDELKSLGEERRQQSATGDMSVFEKAKHLLWKK